MPATGELVKYKEQQCKQSIGDFSALAITSSPETSKLVRDESITDVLTLNRKWDERPTQIQICPWFVDWVKFKNFKTPSDVKKRTKIGRAVIKPVESTNWGLRPIDAFSLLNKVILHEMTHGRSAWLDYVEDERIIGTENRLNCWTTQLQSVWMTTVGLYLSSIKGPKRVSDNIKPGHVDDNNKIAPIV
ncbi:uncharacterized protein BDZ99DRAFT_526623 [Mytilinidion resinicola]|uniref:Lysine-specific metallo-endopeptidase domain-containing protein n=1 Tax=Mytilinidion resinicola TaxID=574789 RepID=A0A6A6Y354_9PEZI|nr:uncharacterized protein BDZ99DRAFT_526623 [Mytilinidion resinicola]KAF2803251.1 hypothetical protein BDZ99DRAFT_526623 [Mytilinidion resinicola]